MTLEALPRISALVAGGRRFLVTMHVRPDGDAIGSSLALAHALAGAGKMATVYSSYDVPESCRFLPGADEIRARLDETDRFDATFALDAGELARLGPDLPSPERRGPLVNLDHHASGEPFGDVWLIDPSAAATGVVVARVLDALGLAITPPIAACLWVSLVSDTGSFRHANTNAEALRLAARLVEAGATPAIIADQMSEHPPVSRLRAFGAALATTEASTSGRVAWVCLRGEAGLDTERLIPYPRSVAGAVVAALFREEAGTVRVSLRSNGPFDVGAFAKARGGGGHAAAAGFDRAGTPEEVRREIVDALERALDV